MSSNNDSNLDVEEYFLPIEWLEMSDIAKTRAKNVLENYRKLKEFGFRPQDPDFVKAYKKRKEEDEIRAKAIVQAQSKKVYKVNEGASTSSGASSNPPISKKSFKKSSTDVQQINQNADTSRPALQQLKNLAQLKKPVQEPTSLSVRLDIEKYFSDREWARKTDVERESLRAELETYSLNRTFGRNPVAPVFVVAYKERKIKQWKKDREMVISTNKDGSKKTGIVKKALKPAESSGNEKCVSGDGSRKDANEKESVKPGENSQKSVQVRDDSSVFKIPAIPPKKSIDKSNQVASTSSASDQNSSKGKTVKSGKPTQISSSLRKKIKAYKAKINKEKKKKEEEELYEKSKGKYEWGGFIDHIAGMTFEETDDLCFTAEEIKISLSVYHAVTTMVQFPTTEDRLEEEKDKTEKNKEVVKKNDKAKPSARSQSTVASSSSSVEDGASLDRTAQPQTSGQNRNESETKGIRRYPKRGVPVKNYAEPDNINMDDFVFCDDCGREWFKECNVHGKMMNIPDLPVDRKKAGDSFAKRTTPRMLGVAQSKIVNAGRGVWTRDMIRQQVQFGPYKGRVGRGNPKDPNYAWQLREMKGGLNYVDASDERFSNWMRYVNCARNINEMNLMAFQFEGAIYYRTFRLVSPHEELFVFYGEQFGSTLGIDVKNFKNPVQTTQQDVSFYCAECNSVFTSPLFLEQHEMTCLLGLGATKKQRAVALKNGERLSLTADDAENGRRKKSSDGVGFVCDVCSARLSSSHSLICHVKRMHDNQRPFKCADCVQAFVNKCELQKHINEVHLKVKLFKCNMCDYKCSRRFLLEQHISSVHLSERKFKCNMCDYKCSRRFLLEQHISSVHLSERKFKCNMCDYKCTRSSHLKQHISAVHLKERKFECSQCGLKFTQNSHLKCHIRSKHLKE